ncbi:MAG: WhiB family transcriptional regulator [Acidimicrobiales bacterium]
MILVEDEGLVPPMQRWRKQAACRGVDPEVFFPDDDGEESKLAKKVCGSCDVQDLCLSYAIRNKEKGGVWGGATERERRRIIRQNRRKTA